jgi:hypothetical protein
MDKLAPRAGNRNKYIGRKLELDWGFGQQKATLRRMATQPLRLSRVDGTACEVRADTPTHHATLGGPTQYSQTTAETPAVSVRVPSGTHERRAVPRRNPRALFGEETLARRVLLHLTLGEF